MSVSAPMFRFTIRDVLWLTVVVAMGVGCSTYSVSKTGSVRRSKTTIETLIPITVAEARQYTRTGLPDTRDLPLPDSATNVQFAFYREWAAFYQIVRFEAPPDDCIAAAKAAIDAHNSQYPDRAVPGLSSSIRVESWDVDTSPFKAAWFRPQDISRGLMGGETGSHLPKLWVDTDAGVFYYRYTD